MTARHILMAAIAAAILSSPASAQSRLAGAWEMTAYEGSANVGKASGILMLTDDRFSLVYTMEEPSGRVSGRAHAGRYTHRGDELVLEVAWSMDYVSGKGSATQTPFRRAPRVALAGDELTITYENGGVHRFRRVAGEPRGGGR